MAEDLLEKSERGAESMGEEGKGKRGRREKKNRSSAVEITAIIAP